MDHQGGRPLPRSLAVVPARLGSTRLPRKMLLSDSGAPLVVETARNALASGVFTRLVIAADSKEVLEAARQHGLEALATDPSHPSGTDRVREAVDRLALDDVDVVVNVQGDEPELAPSDLVDLVAVFADLDVEIASLWCPLPAAEVADPSAVKVVLDQNGDALYFSRSPIPALGHGHSDVPVPGGDGSTWKRHVGVYAYRPAALRRFCALPPGQLEVLERLEQLRWLEQRGSIRMVRAAHPTSGIDTASDYAAYVERARRRAPRTRSDEDDT
ncbi:MAG: 3-deoxy-manno-octulosonate cytidylyltransferase [Planctomycetaceae bacterium]|nr:3-deoxy-manno-octulosonate cytidylyltransferase [Planctomycetaceae bacterium]